MIIHWQFLRAVSRSAGYSWGFWVVIVYSGGFPSGSVVENPPAVQEIPETWVRSLGREDPLEKEMTTHSSVLAWGIPWTEEPGRIQFIVLQRAGHSWATERSACYDQYMKANEQMHIIIVKHAGASLVSLMITSSRGCFLLVLSVFVILSYSPFSLAAVSYLCCSFHFFVESFLSRWRQFQELAQHCNRWIRNSCEATSDCWFGIVTTACPWHVYV